MAKPKSGDESSGGKIPRDPSKESPLRFLSPLWARDRAQKKDEAVPPTDDFRKAEVRDGNSPSLLVNVFGVGAAAAAAFAGGYMLGGSYSAVEVQRQPTPTSDVVKINAVASGLASLAPGATAEQKADAESLFRKALSAVWGEFESIIKDIVVDELKELFKSGIGVLVYKKILKPLIEHMKPHRENPVVDKIVNCLKFVEDKLKADSHAEISEQNVANWTELAPTDAQLLLRAMKLEKFNGCWKIQVDRPSLALLIALQGKAR